MLHFQSGDLSSAGRPLDLQNIPYVWPSRYILRNLMQIALVEEDRRPEGMDRYLVMVKTFQPSRPCDRTIFAEASNAALAYNFVKRT